MPVSIDIKVDAGNVIIGLETIGRSIPIIANTAIRQEMELAKGKIIAYPAPLPNQRYRRTGTYKRAFKIVPLSKGLFNPGYSLVGEAIEAKRGREYTRYVGGREDGTGQAAIHRNRWPLIYTEAKAASERVVARMETGLASIINKVGFGIGRIFKR